ncbi:DEAD/DEAH box helicase [Galenea microaerophila]
MINDIVYDGRRVWVSNKISPEIKKAFKQYSTKYKFYYHPKAKRWVFVQSKAREALLAISKHLKIDENKTLQSIKSARYSFEFAKFLTFDIYPIKNDPDKLVVFCPFDWASAYFFRTISGIFDKSNNAWIVETDIESLVEDLHEENKIPLEFIRFYSTTELFVDTDSIKNLFKTKANLEFESGEKVIERQQKEFGTISATILNAIQDIQKREYDAEPVNAFLKKIGALQHQVEGCHFILSRTSCLLADDMGLGKTLQAVVAGHFIPGIKVVLCPKSLKLNWGNEIKKWTQSDNFYVCPNRSVSIPEGKEWYIFNYELSDKLIEFLEEKNIKEVSCAFFDEAHELKNPKSIKSRNSFKLGAKAANRVLITGTPILNRLNELHTLLMLSGHELGKVPRKEFLEIYNTSMKSARMLKSLLDGSWMIRREKDILGASLPGKTEQIIPLQIENTDIAKYNEILKDPNSNAIVKFNHLRRLIEDIKVNFICNQIEQIYNNHKVLIFCEYKETIDRFSEFFEAKGIEYVTYFGQMSSKKREAAVNAIQQGSARVFIGTTRAAGVGITLTEADHVFFASLPWTQALKEQAEDRANRIGQKNLVKIITPIVQGTIDEHLKKIIDNKKTLSECVIKNDLSPDVKTLIMKSEILKG